MLTAINEYKRFTKIIAAILLLFMITSCIYESFKKPLIILMVLPLAMIGVFLIYYFTESYFTTGSYAGLILLFGLAVNNSIILVDYISKLEKRGLPVHKAIIYGSIRRTKPILMTSVTTFIGFIPFVTLTNQNSIWYGISLSVIGGIISSSIIVLFIVPCIYYIIFHKKN
ncbi:MAG TPA: efflux RND transporter permease subunit, partial [Ignavibacteria bacterium]